MGGEALDSVRLDARGLDGDRWYAVQDADGRLASGKNTRRFRRRDEVFAYVAMTSPGGGITVSGADRTWPVEDPELAAELTRSMGTSVSVVPESGVPHQDAGAVSIVGTATLAWCAAEWGIDADPRRLRANVLVETDEPFVEEEWRGQQVTLGDAGLRVVGRVERCRTIDLAQDGTSAEGRWLAPLTQARDMCVAVYADVDVPGTIRVGDAVTLEADDAST